MVENKTYSYLLGQYLGDGYINKTTRTYRLRIFNDIKNVSLNEFIIRKLSDAFPKNKVNSYKLNNVIVTYVYSNKIPNLFPQHGKGLKNSRNVELLDWQREIMDYQYLLAGLLHSDGCAYFDRGYRMYSFKNTSKDILNIFIDCCNALNLSYSKTKNYIYIRKRESVSWVYKNIGDKQIIKLL